MPNRYSAAWVNPMLVHLLDSKFNGAVAAHVFLRRTVNGDGWQLAPMTTTRSRSRKLHSSPWDAIASMAYMSLLEARTALKPASPLEVSRRHGADIRETEPGQWRVMEGQPSPLWFARFDKEEDAASAYCIVHNLSLTAEKPLVANVVPAAEPGLPPKASADDAAERTRLGMEIYDFLGKHAGVSADYDPKYDDASEQYSSPDAAMLHAAADALVSKEPEMPQVWSSWQSGGFHPLNDAEAEAWHNRLVAAVRAYERAPTPTRR